VKADESNLFEALKGDRTGTHLERRFQAQLAAGNRVAAPPFPRQIQVETANVCNHACTFCEYPTMERRKGLMERATFFRVVAEAHALGAREIGLFAGAEPLAAPALEEFVAYCHRLGYEYSYLTTNGALADATRWTRLLDAGLRSVKFSVNAGTREVYRAIHGADDFERVLANVRFVAAERRRLPHRVFVGVSFVGVEANRHTFDRLKELVGEVVDEVMYYPAVGRAGHRPDLPPLPLERCPYPFNKATITREGYLRACCNDYENLLAVEDLGAMSLRAAWNSPRFEAFRTLHLEDRLQGTLCANCIRGATARPAPLNASLSRR